MAIQSATLKTEIEAMRKVEAALAPLPAKTRKRVITYIMDEYMADGTVAHDPALPADEGQGQ